MEGVQFSSSLTADGLRAPQDPGGSPLKMCCPRWWGSLSLPPETPSGSQTEHLPRRGVGVCGPWVGVPRGQGTVLPQERGGLQSFPGGAPAGSGRHHPTQRSRLVLPDHCKGKMP